MLALDDPQWGALQHAYGTAEDIPKRLRQLAHLPPSKGDSEPWFYLWSALAHQGDVFSASFAAVPHVVAALASNPLQADSTYFHFPAWVECCRVSANMAVPDDLAFAYKKALRALPALVAEASQRPWDEGFTRCALAAIAVAKGNTVIAEAILELEPETAERFFKWLQDE